MKKNLIFNILIIFTITLFSALYCPLTAFARDQKSIAILPFDIISSDDLSYVRTGILQMMHSRLIWKDKVTVVEPKMIEHHLKELTLRDPWLRAEKLAELTDSDYILTGSITHYLDSFSVDTRVYDIKNKQLMTFFEQSTSINDLISKLNIVSAKINKDIFDRKTTIYYNLVKEEEEKAAQQKRQNPEHMMRHIPLDGAERKPPFWKFWEYL